MALDQSTTEAFAKLDGAIKVIATTQTELPNKIVALVTTKDALIATLRKQLADAQTSDPATSDQIAKDAKVIADLQQAAIDRTTELNDHLNTSAGALQTAADAFAKIDLTDHSEDPTTGTSSDTSSDTGAVVSPSSTGDIDPLTAPVTTSAETLPTSNDVIPSSVSL